MTKETNKFHALQLFTDTFTAETVHLTNEEIGIYIRLLSFAWTKNTKPFTTESAFRICQCKTQDCKITVMNMLYEFFISENLNPEIDEIKNTWTHKRLVKEHAYLVDKYKRRSEAGKKGGRARVENASSKNQAPIPKPKPIPNKNIYDEHFEELWNKLKIKRGSKFKAFQEYCKLDKHTGCTVADLFNADELSKIYNSQQQGVENKFIPHFSTWLSQRRWEMENENNPIPDLIDRLVNLGYVHKGTDGNFELFNKDGKDYKIDIFDDKHQMQLIQ
jgi:uncharacterized protein YdaU (DUF1376 family)